MATMTKPKPNQTAADPAWGGTMEIPHRTKVSLCVSKDVTRPILNHGYLRQVAGEWWLCGTDSYTLAVVKVQVAGDVHDGYVPIGALKLMERGAVGTQMSPTAWRVATHEGQVTFDVEGVVTGTAAFPDFVKLGVLDSPAKPSGVIPCVGFNPKFMKQAAEAIGAGNSYGIEVYMSDALRAFHLRCPLHGDNARALVMPVRVA